MFRCMCVSTPGKLHQFTLTLNTETCLRDRRFYVSPTAVDVQCDNLLQLYLVKISGAAVGALCSLNIVAGQYLSAFRYTFSIVVNTYIPSLLII